MNGFDFNAYLNSGWIQTYSGRMVLPFVPELPENTFTIEDIAHHLSMICRWNGAVMRFYSVAEHCVLGSRIVDDSIALRFLLHDCEEAYIGDICRPVKLQLWIGAPLHVPEMRLAEAGDHLRRTILNRLGVEDIDKDTAEKIRRVDDAVMVREALELLRGGPHREFAMQPRNGFLPADVRPFCWDPEIAESKFLARFAELARR